MAQQGHLLPFPQAPDGVELRHLRAFVAVAEELNFSRAADRLYVSQPALSRQIRGLEQLVGCQLLKRSTHQVELTVAGEALLERSRKLLSDVDEAVSAALAVGGEHLARIARLLDPARGLITEQAMGNDLQDVREAFESLQGQLAPPPGTRVRPVTAGGVQSLVVSPGDDARPTVLYLHGGAYIVGSAFGYQSHAGALALAAQTGVLIPDYRLAPEHPFPAALEDALRAYRWLLGRGMTPEEVVLAGDSSGAGLVMSVLLTLKQEHAAMPGAAVLFCPWLDLAQRLPADSQTAIGAVPSTDEARRCAHAYLADHPANDPIVDPLSADLTGLPPLLIQAATGDARIADAKALAMRAHEKGVDARLELFPVDAHAFQLFWSFLPEAADAMDIAGSYIRELHTGPAQSRHGRASASAPAG
jgi:monoterpene epsilon-lactone hydrolase